MLDRSVRKFVLIDGWSRAARLAMVDLGLSTRMYEEGVVGASSLHPDRYQLQSLSYPIR